ncbi:MAG TPA: TolC family protein [Polyangiaceae bacterium]|nr:TolC family protein [Polyangiaceae bacterium]
MPKPVRSSSPRSRSWSPCCAVAVLACLAQGCIASDAGYADARRVVHDRVGQDVKWRAVDSSAANAEKETASLLDQPLTADAAVRVAMLNNHDVQAAFEEIGIARARLVSAVALPNPELEGRIGFVRGGEPEYTFVASESISDLVWLPLRESAARAELDAAKLAVAGRLLDFVFAVKVAFYEQEAAERVLVLTRTTRDAAEASYEAAERLHEAGNIPDLDFITQRALREESDTAAEEAEVERSRAEGQLALLLGVPTFRIAFPAGGKNQRDTDQSAIPAKELDLARLDARALSRSLDVEIARREADAASKRASLARATGIVPELRGGFEAERLTGEPWAFGPMAALRLPLFYQGQGQVAEAESQMRRATETRAALLERVGREAKLAGDRLLAARKRVTRYEQEILPLRRRIVEETLLRYNAMIVGVFQLLQAKRDQVESELKYARAVRDYFIARTEVELFLAGRIPASRPASETTLTRPPPTASSHE